MGHNCEVRPHFIGAWRKYVGDPDTEVEKWLVIGSPLGITERPVSRNIFPMCSDLEAAADPSSLISEPWQGGKITKSRSRP